MDEELLWRKVSCTSVICVHAYDTSISPILNTVPDLSGICGTSLAYCLLSPVAPAG